MTGCVRTADGAVQCFGANEVGQIGDGTNVTLTGPRKVDLGVKPDDRPLLALGPLHACLADSASLRCWGDAAHGKLGIGVEASSRRAPEVVLPGPTLALAVARDHSCAIRKVGTDDEADIVVHCWGANGSGQLGDGTQTDRPEPKKVMEVVSGPISKSHPKRIALGERYTCVESVFGTGKQEEAVAVRCFGAMSAKPLFQAEPLRGLASGPNHACAIKAKDGSVWCWGKNDSGQLGDGGTTDATEPVATGMFGAADLAVGDHHTCARVVTGTVTCWGANDHHQLANGTTEKSTRPIPVHGLLGVVQLVAAGDATCARIHDGDVRCFGKNDRYQLGDGTTVEHVVPMAIKLRPEPQ